MRPSSSLIRSDFFSDSGRSGVLIESCCKNNQVNQSFVRGIKNTDIIFLCQRQKKVNNDRTTGTKMETTVDEIHKAALSVVRPIREITTLQLSCFIK